MPKKSKEEDIQKNLDEAFQEFLEEMRPFILKLERKEERQTISSWIKKLCHSSISSITERKNRNLYTQILLQMLRSKNIREPFHKQPPTGKLATIPAYMSSYLDETANEKVKNSFTGPEWLQGEEFDDSILSQTINHESYQKYKDILSPRKHERFMLSTSIIDTISPMKVVDEDKTKKGFLDNSDANELELYLNAENNKENLNSTEIHKTKHKTRLTKPESIRSLTFNPDHNEDDNLKEEQHRDNNFKKMLTREKELELKLRMMDGRVQEETLKIQQQHDQMVKKILDRKNQEMGDMKLYYQSKIAEVEDSLKQYEKKVKRANEELKLMHDKHSSEVGSLKEAVQRKASTTAAEYEKMMYDKLSDFETEIFNLQKMHRQNIEEILTEADDKMKSLKIDFSGKNENLHLKMVDLTQQFEESQKVNQNLMAEKNKMINNKEHMQEKISNVLKGREDAIKKTEELEKEKNRVIDEYEDVVRDLKKKSDHTFEAMKKERKTTSTKSSATIAELESKISHYRQTAHDMELKRQRELREQEAIHKQQILELEITQEKQARVIQSEFESKELEYQARIGKYELSLKEKAVETNKLEIKLKEHSKETDSLIETFKRNAEDNSSRMFEELNSQLQNLQTSLSLAKEKIEQQKSDFSKRHEDQRTNYEKQISQYKETYESEKIKFNDNCKQEHSMLINNHSKEKQEESLKHQNLLKEMENKYKKQIGQYVKTISDLEAQVRDLREQVIQANSVRKEQLHEIGVLREEEKQAARKNEETLLSKYKSQTEQLRLQLQKEHSSQMTEYTEKMDARLKYIDAEYTKRAAQDNVTIASLHSQITDIKTEYLSKINTLESKLKDTKLKRNEEKKTEQHEFEINKKKVADELETQHIKYKQLEKKYRNMEVQSQEKISKCRLEYEQKINGLLPVTVKKELEDTIDSMRQQIHMLQSRADLLQEELDVSNKFTYSRNHSELKYETFS